MLRAQSVAHHDGHRRGQTQGAGAADDQHRDAPGQGVAYLPAQQQPDHKGRQGNGNDRRNEDARDLVGHLGNGGLGGGGVADHADDLGQGGILSHPGGPAGQEARLVEGRRRDRAARGLVHGNALAGEGSLVDGALALQDHAVHRDMLAGPDYKGIPGQHLTDGHLGLHPGPEHRGLLRRQLHQTLEGVGGPALGPGLQHLAHGNQRENHGRRLEIEVMEIGHGVGPGAGHGEEAVGTIDKGRRGAQGHQGIHIGGPVPQGPVARDKKLLIDDHDDGRQQQLHQPQGHGVALEKGRNRPAAHHMAHGEVHQHRQKAHRPQEPPLQHRRLPVLQDRGVGGSRLLGCALFGRAVARLLHGLDDGLGRGRALHAHGVGQQAHRTGRDPRHLTDGLLHPGAAGRAAHARDVVLLHGAPSHGGRPPVLAIYPIGVSSSYTPAPYLSRGYFISFWRVAKSSSMTASLPARMSSATQVRIWLASSSLLKAFMAAVTAADCTKISGQ